MELKGIAICGSDFPKTMGYLLVKQGWELLRIPDCANLNPYLAGHPELQLFVIDKDEVVIHPDLPENFINKLLKYFQLVIIGGKKLGEKYPYDIPYNGLLIGKTFFHRLDSTDYVLRNKLNAKGFNFIDVPQGYTGCSVLKVGGEAIITADIQIALVAQSIGIDVLKIQPGFIELKGMSYGFIGGASGWDGDKKVYFCGNINFHPDSERIISFVNKHGIEVFCLSEKPLADFGSLIFIKNPFAQ